MSVSVKLQGRSYGERRFKAVRLTPWDVLHCLRWREHGCITLTDFDGLPEDFEVVSLHGEEVPCSFVVVLHHPSWDVVPEGEAPPVLHLRRVMVKVERSESDPYAVIVPPSRRPPLDTKMVEESRAELDRGEGRDVRDLIRELGGDPQALERAGEALDRGKGAADVNAFLEDVYGLAANGDLQSATDRVFDRIDRLLCAGSFAACDLILKQVDVTRLPTALMRSFLTITAPGKKYLPARRPLYDRIVGEVTRLRGGGGPGFEPARALPLPP